MQKSSIGWTNKTWNAVTGCTKVSQGCKNCYAETIANRFWGERKFTDIICHEDRLEQPLHIKKPSMIFVNSMSDLFHESVKQSFIADIFHIMWRTPQHTYQILTKRPKRMETLLSYWQKTPPFKDMKLPLSNVWLGVSAEDQTTADERIPLLLQTPAAIRWLSVEPMLEEINLFDIYKSNENLKYFDWVVVGAESGDRRRPCKTEWIESIVDQCKQNQIPVFVKQMEINGRISKEIIDFPKHLQIQEYPNQ